MFEVLAGDEYIDEIVETGEFVLTPIGDKNVATHAFVSGPCFALLLPKLRRAR